MSVFRAGVFIKFKEPLKERYIIVCTYILYIQSMCLQYMLTFVSNDPTRDSQHHWELFIAEITVIL